MKDWGIKRGFSPHVGLTRLTLTETIQGDDWRVYLKYKTGLSWKSMRRVITESSSRNQIQEFRSC